MRRSAITANTLRHFDNETPAHWPGRRLFVGQPPLNEIHSRRWESGRGNSQAHADGCENKVICAVNNFVE